MTFDITIDLSKGFTVLAANALRIHNSLTYAAGEDVSLTVDLKVKGQSVVTLKKKLLT